MRSRLAFLAVLVAITTLGGAVSVAREPGAVIVEFGRYEVRPAGEAQRAERTASGVVQPVTGHRLVEKTDVIVGQPGNTFGIEVKFVNFAPGTVTVTLRKFHPPLTNPKTGKTTTVSEYDWPVRTDQSSFFCFSFDEGWEIAEGDWTMQVVYKGKVVAEKKFKIVVAMN